MKSVFTISSSSSIPAEGNEKRNENIMAGKRKSTVRSCWQGDIKLAQDIAFNSLHWKKLTSILKKKYQLKYVVLEIRPFQVKITM